MIDTPRHQLRTLAAAVLIAVLCELVAHATQHHHGLADVVSWVTFVGFWLMLVVAALLVALLVTSLVRGRRSVRS